VNPLQRALIRLQTDVRLLDLRWTLLGGLAVSVRAEPRTTRDVDIAVVVEGDHEAEQIVREFWSRGYRLKTPPLEHLDVGRMATVRFLAPGEDARGVVVDLLFASSGIESALSIGGDHGMPLAIIQEFLGLDLPRTRKLAIDLAAGGVLSEVGKNALAVRPRALRSALLRHVFFQGSATDHDYRPLLVQAPSFASAALSIVTAKSYGAKVPSQELRRIVSHSGSPKVWQAFAALGEDEARWALDHYPGDLLDLAREILAHVPRVAIPKLLERAVGETGPLHSQPAHPLRLLKDWIEQLDVAPAEAMRRRMVTAKLAKRYLMEGGDRDVGIHALLLALSPRVESVGAEPVGEGVIIRWGLLPSSQLHEMQAVWEEGRDAIKDLDPVTWRHLKDALWGWIYPRYAAGSSTVPEGVVASNYEKLEEWQQKESADLRDLAKRWASKGDPHGIAKKLALYLDEATRIGHRKWPPRIQTLCIAGASFSLTRMSCIWESGQDHWSQWDQAFAVFEAHPEEELREVARHGRRIAQNHIHGATSEQRRDELCGP